MKSRYPKNDLNPQNRVGFHYYQDTIHYSQRDLQIWLPYLLDVGASWLVLTSETGRAIPESFITGLINAGISPIVQFQASLAKPPTAEEVSPLIEAYIHWGVKYIQFFDRPNARSAWPAGTWTQQDLVERFLDRYLPLANVVVRHGGCPVLPPLEPGVNFWDTAFLRSTLSAMERRKQSHILHSLVLSAYAWTLHHPLDWGKGGPECWPDARPYFTPADSQDQRGFHIFDWYEAITQAVLHRKLPIILLQSGLPAHPNQVTQKQILSAEYLEDIHKILQAAQNPLTSALPTSNNPESALLSPSFPSEVISSNFWLLAAESTSPYMNQAWFVDEEPALAIAEELAEFNPTVSKADFSPAFMDENFFKKITHPVNRYLLLPEDDLPQLGRWLTRLLPYIHKNNPTIGFSLEEASLAAHVMVAGDSRIFTDDHLDQLRKRGCKVERINENGITFAS